MRMKEEKDARERRVRGHSARVAILDLLSEDGRELTAAQIRARLPGGPPLANVRYHLRVLGDSYLVVVAGGRYRLPG
jgi:DNA-binding transcriptional ArsR family regulator